jgi:hypothetical protein
MRLRGKPQNLHPQPDRLDDEPLTSPKGPGYLPFAMARVEAESEACDAGPGAERRLL